MSNLVWKPVQVRLGQIKPWTNNPRLSTKAQAERLIQSERELGQVQTIAIGPAEDDGKFPLYDGHQRFSAWFTVKGADFEMTALQSNRPLTEDERRKMSILLHTATGGWDWNQLSGWQVGELKEWGLVNQENIKGWNNDANNAKELLKAEQETQDAEPQIDRAAELLEKWQVKTGDLWQIGDHRLICGDCTDAAVVARIIEGGVDLWIIDPPYGINWQGSNASTLEWDGIEGDRDLMVAKGIIEQLPEQQSAVIFGANCFPELLPHRGRWLCWDKRITEEADRMLGSAFELAWQNKVSGFDVMFRVLHGGVVNSDGGKRYHPTQKPIELYKKIIEYYKANTVYDSCVGAGTTLLACQNLGRRGRAIEISPAYCSVTLERMAQAFPGIEIKRL